MNYVLEKTLCPICQTDRFDREVYPRTLKLEDLSSAMFVSHKFPDRVHYRMVRCGQCGLLRSGERLPQEALAEFYRDSGFTYEAEVKYTRRTYGVYLRRLLELWPRRGSLLEIGCGSGFFLEEALAQGFSEVHGVEPSDEAINHAPENIRGNIRKGLYGADTFSGEQFDVICALQLFDHVPDPVAFLKACYKDLRPGGALLFINHNAKSLSARILGDLNPIIDLEHTVLYDKRTMARIFTQAGFHVREVFSVKNTYPLIYWTKLAPLPRQLKLSLLKLLEGTRAGSLQLALRAGNLGMIATKDEP